ncbi:MAG: DUF5777 family beta-barrel protein [Cyclobacteriaceae bacterium]|nr:DUF5777 family beta-barrel protein [Cyclobacteriaceae bacterium]
MKKLVVKILYPTLILIILEGYSQETKLIDPVPKEYTEGIFTGTLLINSQTTTTLQPKSWSFGIQHRFGQVSLDSTLLWQFLGLDLPSVIRFSFGWSFSDRFYVEVGRSNYLKTVDLEAKYLLVKQTEDFRTPISIAAYFNTAIRTENFPEIPDNAYFEDGITPFKYKPSHRFAYNAQLILSSKVSEKISLQVTPIFIYQNLADPLTDNFTLVLSGGGRYKLGLSSSLVAEYAYVYNNRGNEFHNPFSVGVEFGTVGHTFQLFVSNASKILESHIYTSSAFDISEGEFLLGFNLKRVFWRKNKKS